MGSLLDDLLFCYRKIRGRAGKAARKNGQEDDDTKKAYVILALILGLTGILGGALAENSYTAVYLDIFDTVTSITGYAESKEVFSARAEEIYQELLRYHRLYDIYNAYEGMVNLCSINAHAGEKMEAAPEIIGLLELAKEACDFSGGKVDVTMGALLNVWHRYREEGLEHPESAELPTREELEAAAVHRGFDRIDIDKEKGTILLTDPEMRLDVGALGKGYALQQVASKLEGSWLISIGGNVFATGPKSDGSPWKVGVQNPDGEGTIHMILLRRGAVVSSGDYARYYTVDGIRYHHIIDPDTLYPGEKWQAVTVLCEDSGLADAVSTTLFLLGREEGDAVLDKIGAEAFRMTPEGECFYTDGYRELMK